ncbi:MAG: Curved DNA-binding protein [Pseudomonadota bacterium]|jgi:DnaJ-class molecular chaperone
MQNHYKLLGLNTSATPEEIRRAYRILARRYHPDVNPGKASEDKFKSIAEAHRILSDPERRKSYDAELENHLRAANPGADPRINAYRRNQSTARTSARQKYYEARYEQFGKVKPEGVEETKRAEPTTARQTSAGVGGDLSKFASLGRKTLERMFGSGNKGGERPREREPRGKPSQSGENGGESREIAKISLIEVSVTLNDVVNGVKKTVEIAEPEGVRKVSVRIPPGVRNGSVVHLRSRGGTGEDLVIIVRVANHPFLSMHTRGLVAEVPISVNEAICGASITLPSLDEPVSVKIPPGAQSGTEIRMKGRGVINKDGSRGDLFYRLMIKVPEAQNAVGFTERASELERYYPEPVRQSLPKGLLDL